MQDKPSLIIRPRTEIAFAPPTIMERPIHAQQQLSLVDIWRMIIRRKVVILGFAATVFGVVTAYTFLKTPIYEGIARLQIDPNRSGSLGLDDSEKPSSSSNDFDSRVKTEVAIIQSDTVALQVMKSLGLYANPSFAGKYTVNGSVQDLSQLSPSNREQLLKNVYKSLF